MCDERWPTYTNVWANVLQIVKLCYSDRKWVSEKLCALFSSADKLKVIFTKDIEFSLPVKYFQFKGVKRSIAKYLCVVRV